MRPIIFTGESVRATLARSKSQTRRVIAGLEAVSEDLDLIRIEKHEGVWKAWNADYPDEGHVPIHCPYVVGALLWVREKFSPHNTAQGFGASCKPADATYVVFGDGAQQYRSGEKYAALKSYAPGAFDSCRWRSPIFMPRWASRLTLRVTGVRVQRLQEISDEDAIAEGITGPHHVGYPAYRIPGDSKPRYSSASAAFERAWDAINGKRAPWSADPWVWAITFCRLEGCP